MNICTSEILDLNVAAKFHCHAQKYQYR